MSVSVLLWNLPAMLADIAFAALSGEQFTVNAAHGTVEQWRDTANSHGVDVVITSFEQGSLVAEGTDLLWQRPRLRMIVLERDASDAVLLQFTLRVDELGQLSPDGLAATVESAMRPLDAGKIARGER